MSTSPGPPPTISVKRGSSVSDAAPSISAKKVSSDAPPSISVKKGSSEPNITTKGTQTRPSHVLIKKDEAEDEERFEVSEGLAHRKRESFFIPYRVTMVLENLDGISGQSSVESLTVLEARAKAGSRKRKMTYALVFFLAVTVLGILSFGLYQLTMNSISDHRWNHIVISKKPFHNVLKNDTLFSGKMVKDVPLIAKNFNKQCSGELDLEHTTHQQHINRHVQRNLKISGDSLKKPVLFDLIIIGIHLSLVLSGLFLCILLCWRKEDCLKTQWIGWGCIGSFALTLSFFYYGSSHVNTIKPFINARIVLESEKGHLLAMEKNPIPHRQHHDGPPAAPALANGGHDHSSDPQACNLKDCVEPDEEVAKDFLTVVKICAYGVVHMNFRDPCHNFTHSIPSGIRLAGRWYSRQDLEALSICSNLRGTKLGFICLLNGGILALLLMWLFSWADKAPAFHDGRQHKKRKEQVIKRVTGIEGITERAENEIPEEMRLADPSTWFRGRHVTRADDPNHSPFGSLDMDWGLDVVGKKVSGVIRRSSFNLNNHNPLMMEDKTKKFVIHPPRASDRFGATSRESIMHPTSQHAHHGHGLAHKLLHPRSHSNSHSKVDSRTSGTSQHHHEKEKGAEWFRKEDDGID